MSRIAIALFAISFLVGCEKKLAPPTSKLSVSPPRKRLTLAEARKGFVTKLRLKNASGEPLPQPPEKLLRRVDFESDVGKLGAYITPDPQDGKPRPAIIWITGGDSSSLDGSIWETPFLTNDQTARQFRAAGIVTMYPTLRGGNQNPGFHEGFYGEVDDVISAAMFLKKQSYVDPQRIYLGGHSSGATLVLLVAECSNEFRAVFSISPIHDLRAAPRQYQDLFQPYDSSDEREAELRAPGDWLNAVEVPVFLFAGTRQDGALASLKIMSRNISSPAVHFLVVEGANHFDIVAPTNRTIADKIVKDTGPNFNIEFSPDELSKPFGTLK